MFVDARTIASGIVVEADLCVIGAGAAGIAIAREFMTAGLRVVLLESGGRKMDPETQALYRGESVGLDYPLDSTRARYFGGSTNLWGGFCRPFEPFHFEHRDWVPHSGWPIGATDLAPYYSRASEVCGLDPGGFAPEHWERMAPGVMVDFIGQASPALESSLYQRATTRRRFGSTYACVLQRSDCVRVFLHANVTEILASDDGRHIAAVAVACLSGSRFTVAARAFVLATGGLENARLLLVSHGVHAAGLGNQTDLVGRYFMEHPRMQFGVMRPTAQARCLALYDTRYAVLNAPIVADFGLTAQAQRDLQLLSWSAHIEARPRAMDHDSVATLFEMYSDLRAGVLPSNSWSKACGVLSGLDSVLAFALGYRLRLPRFIDGFEIAAKIEQCPNAESRVTLADDKDCLGMNRLRLDWRLTELDHRTAARSAAIVAAELTHPLFESLQVEVRRRDEDWLAAPGWTWHHMGTTRMQDDPARGVVDRNCRVHGISNLFVAGSSVFPTAGQNVPTLTIIALAIRLCDHLKASATTLA